VLKKSEDSFKSFFTPGMLFEALKFEYVGPIQGHNLSELLGTLQNVRDFSKGPVLIHVLTTKGKGYPPAEKNPGDYHGLGPFDVDSGAPEPMPPGPPTYTKVFGDTLIKIARDNPKVTAITAAMPAGTGLTEFAAAFPDRFFDVGIAEQHGVTFAAGMASEGMRPVVAIYSTFLQRALDQIIHDVCLPNLPVTFAIDRGGVVGEDGPTHHGVFDISFLRFIPNLVCMAPKDENELQHMLHTAILHKGPAAVRYPRGRGVGTKLSATLKILPIGKGEVLRQGTDVLLLPVGNRVYPALEAAAGLAKIGIDAAVINPRFIKPIDGELILEWTRKTGKVVTIEDNVRQGGFGSRVLELLARERCRAQVKLLAFPDQFIEHGAQEILWKNAHLDSPAIINAAMELVNGKAEE
jgi:1-deoxy-D-xylulose-5-phosphate synthase